MDKMSTINLTKSNNDLEKKDHGTLFLSLYYGLLILLICLIGQGIFSSTISYFSLFLFLITAFIKHAYWGKIPNAIKSLLSDKAGMLFTLFLLFSFVSDYFGLQLKLSIIQSLGILAVFYFIKIEAETLNFEDMKSLINLLFIISSAFILLTSITIIIFPNFILINNITPYVSH